jgi:hypothetical protein
MAAIGWAMLRIREHRALRYGLITGATLLAVVFSRLFGLGDLESDVVEQVHFIEYGLITWLFYRAWQPVGGAASLILTVLSAWTIGILEEWVQWFVPARVGEVRDVFLNLGAIACGLLVSIAVRAPGRSHKSPPRAIWSYGVSGVALAAFAGFIDAAHLGHEIADPPNGVFRSIYSADELRAAAVDRERRWQLSPPLVPPPRFSPEDQYFSEAMLHVQERNRRWSSGDILSAWKENQILETYFGPAIDTPSYVSSTGHRWAPEQRADAERRGSANNESSTFESQAFGSFPILLWPRTTFRLLSAGAVGALLGFAAMRDRQTRRSRRMST